MDYFTGLTVVQADKDLGPTDEGKVSSLCYQTTEARVSTVQSLSWLFRKQNTSPNSVVFTKSIWKPFRYLLCSVVVDYLIKVYMFKIHFSLKSFGLISIHFMCWVIFLMVKFQPVMWLLNKPLLWLLKDISSLFF